MPTIALKAFAKINLGLSVLGRRDDGFHELRTIYQSISLADDVQVQLHSTRGPVRLELSGIPVPEGVQNLAVRAAEAVRKLLRTGNGVEIRLHKRIPPASGLGGASSDAAAVVRALCMLLRSALPPERLLHLAAELGSDVPYFLLGGRALGVGRGEEVYPLPEGARRWVVVLFPGEGMSTAAAYRLLRRPRLTVARARPTIEVFCGQMMASATQALGNDFEPLLFRKRPRLAAVKRRLLRAGAEQASLSGSGSALYGLFEDAAAARRAAAGLTSVGGSVFLARTVSRREFFRTWPGAASRR